MLYNTTPDGHADYADYMAWSHGLRAFGLGLIGNPERRLLAEKALEGFAEHAEQLKAEHPLGDGPRDKSERLKIWPQQQYRLRLYGRMFDHLERYVDLVLGLDRERGDDKGLRQHQSVKLAGAYSRFEFETIWELGHKLISSGCTDMTSRLCVWKCGPAAVDLDRRYAIALSGAFDERDRQVQELCGEPLVYCLAAWQEMALDVEVQMAKWPDHPSGHGLWSVLRNPRRSLWESGLKIADAP